MEHLTRNTNNDRLIYTIENKRKEDQDAIDKNLKELIDKVVNVLTGILSSIVSASIVSIWKDERKIPCHLIISTIIFIIIALVLWFIIGKWIVPSFYKIISKTRIDITPEKESDSVQRLNTEVMQKVAEIIEIMDVIKTTDISQCKILNYVISLYKFQEVVDFMYRNFTSEKKTIRKLGSQKSSELLKYHFNIYTVAAIMKAVTGIQKAMEDFIETDDVIKNLDGIDLLKKDLSEIGKKLKKINISN